MLWLYQDVPILLAGSKRACPVPSVLYRWSEGRSTQRPEVQEGREEGMNGMKKKSQRRKRSARFTEDGIPRDPNEWSAEDWASLHRAVEQAKKEISERHRKEQGHG